MRKAVLEAPQSLFVRCGDAARKITFRPNGSITIEHSLEEIRAMLAAEALGQPVCPCIKARRALVDRSEDDPSILLRGLEGVESICEAAALARKIAWLRGIFRSRAATNYGCNSPERKAIVRRMIIDAEDLIRETSHRSVRIEVTFAAPVMYPIGRLLRDTLGGQGTSWFARTRRYRNASLSLTLGIDFLVRYWKGRWFCRHPESGARFLIVDESGKRAALKDAEVRDCIILVPQDNVRDPRYLLKRVYVDDGGLLLRWVAPMPLMYSGQQAILRRGAEYDPPTKLRRIPSSWGKEKSSW